MISRQWVGSGHFKCRGRLLTILWGDFAGNVGSILTGWEKAFNFTILFEAIMGAGSCLTLTAVSVVTPNDFLCEKLW